MSRNRATLHISMVHDFARWLESNGWSIEPPKGDYEALRARKGKKLAIFHERHGGDHLTSSDAGTSLARSFSRDVLFTRRLVAHPNVKIRYHIQGQTA